VSAPQLQPARWPGVRLRHLCRINPPLPDKSIPPEQEVSYLPMERIGADGRLDLSLTVTSVAARSGLTIFQDGDVIVAKITPCFENGKGALCAGLVNGVGIGTTELHVLRPTLALLPGFLFYRTQATDFRRLGEASMSGAAGQKRVADDFIRDFRVVLPPPAQQAAIVAFLERETGRIDALIEKKQRLIALLEEKRAALISAAVTGQIDVREAAGAVAADAAGGAEG